MSRFDAILAALDRAGLIRSAPAPFEITGVSDDSRRVEPGHLFCAVEGTQRDGHTFVADAVRRGAAGVVVARGVDDAIPQIIVSDTRSGAAIAAREWYGRPADGLRLVGVTGTNGKSTTVATLRHVLDDDRSTGALGTLGAFAGHGEALGGHANLTTPGAVELQQVLAELRDAGVRTVVMEASSHALDQRRLETLSLAGAVFTNLTHDHLDYHRDFDAYRAAKFLLSTYLGSGAVEAVNLDDVAWKALPRRDGIRRVTFGRDRGDVHVTNVRLDPTGSDVTLHVGEWSRDVRIPLPGDFNILNALGAAACAWGMGVDADAIAERLNSAPQVPGRMERLHSNPFVILRDYAHTPDALERAIAALRPLVAGRLVVVFGAGGDRDRTKRPLMGRVAAGGADLAVVTSDNPRTEDPERILDDVEAGMEGVQHLRISDRRAAIAHAIDLLQPGDTLLLAGKGHETYQVVGTDRVPFDEAAIVRELLA